MSEKTGKKIIAFLVVCIVAAAVFFAAVIGIINNKINAAQGGAYASEASDRQPETIPETTQPVSAAPETTLPAETTTEMTTAARPTETTTEKPAETAEQKTTAVPTEAAKAPDTTKKESAESGKRKVVDPKKEPWNLVVVNATREITKGYKPKLTQILNTGKYLDSRVTPHYEAMYKAAKKDGVTLTPYSAYRSYDRQKNNFENFTNQYMKQGLSRAAAEKKAATVVLPAGTSEHNLGIAVDIVSVKDSFANGPEYKWLVKNAHKYGFILRYTAEKQPVTGIVSEPWHWRYVGVDYAKKIKDSGLCLEEYLDSVGIKY